MNPADEPHGSRRERGLIVAEKCAGPGQGYGYLVGILQLSEISNRRGRSILGSKNTQHESRAVHDRHGHIGIHGIHRGLHDILDIGCLQSLHRRDWRRNRRAASAPATHQQHRERSGDSQNQKNAQRQRFLPML
jgi:hypothetical protein